MIVKKNFVFGSFMIFLLLVSVIPANVTAQSSFAGDNLGPSFSSRSSAGLITREARPTFQTFYGNELTTYWPVLGDRATCEARTDLLLSVAPAGCQPTIVRSDLLAEQNVPVFCQIDSYKINPLVDVAQIRGIRFVGDYPPEVAGVGFHPARAALRSQERLLGAPLVNNIGYIVVVLKRQPREADLPEFVNLTLGAQIDYISGNSLGIGRSEFILKELNDNEWESEKFRQSFWNGRYFLRLDEADSNFATVTIYDGVQRVVTQRVERGQTSRDIYVPGFFCRAGLQINYDGFVSADKTARIEVNTDGSADVFEVTESSRFLDGRCSVRTIEINKDGESGRVSLNCGGRSFELRLLSSSVNNFVYEQFNIKEEDAVINVRKETDGSFIFNINYKSLNKKSIYRLDKDDNLYGYLRGDDIKEVLLLDSKGSYNSGINTESDKGAVKGVRDSAIKVKAILNDPNYQTASTSSQSQTGLSWRYFDDAVKDYETVADDFPFEKRDSLEGTPTFGEDALKHGISLAQSFGANDVEKRLINKFRNIYSDRSDVNGYLTRVNELGKVDFREASFAVEIDGRTRVIRLLSLKEPVKKPNAELRVGGERFNINLIERKNIPEVSNNKSRNGEIVLDSLSVDEARLSAYCKNERGVVSPRREQYILRIDDAVRNVCGVDVSLARANTETAAKIRLTPRAEGTQTITNFSVSIGIEKRALEITPEKARKKIENLNKSIEEWEEISDKLGDVVTGMKSACFATSALLTFKNFASGLSGESLARQQVMNGQNGWKTRCADMVAWGEKGYSTLDACFTGEAGKIDAEVATQVRALNKVNAQIQKIQNEEITTAGGISNIFGQTVDADAVRNKLAAYARQEYGSEVIDLTKLRKEWRNPQGEIITSISVNDILSQENVNSGVVSTDAIREIMLNAELRKAGVGEAQLKNVNSNLLETADRINENRIIQGDLAKADQLKNEGFAQPFLAGAEGQRERVANVRSASNEIRRLYGFGDLTHTATVVVPASTLVKQGGPSFESGTYVLGLKETDARRGIYNIERIWDKDTRAEISNKGEFLKVYGIGRIKAADRTSLNNEIVSADRVCRFYETEPYRGMPAVLPFDVREGWYAATRQTLPVFGGIGAFDASGRVTSFWLCNVGENGRVEFESGFGDDLCQQINLNTGQPLGSFPGLSESAARAKINQAVRAIQDAARQYPNKFITINGERCEVGKPSVGQPGTQCQDFMSPTDCHLLFNVCDPVICPNSRCDFGGQYPVANVAQTGIVGSTLLCLPNIKEGIVVPVCLTGIKAGLDGWVSIMRNYRDCLQENIDTGETVGICDQIHSVYLCEFFWGQVAPFVNVLIPKLIEVAYGQGVRGGGEYLTVQSAWQNMENSINYFTNSYAVNSLTAFQTRTSGQYGRSLYSTASIAELGTELCRNAISVKAPKAFEALVEPDSPPQFHAWFDEKVFTTATVPATSQYKVFYHIFAGNDIGASFQVYLKSPPESSYYATNPYVVVASGFVPRGEYASETRDFTAPQGYKELCVRVNNQEECGFGQVSTSFAVDYLRDVYIGNELQRTDITTERDCVSGSPNPGALLTPNIQAGVEEVASPTIYNRGVVRICSTENPGKTTNPERFVNTGYCGDKKVGCWLDKTSVDRALSRENVGIKNATLEVLEDRVQEFLENNEEIFSEAVALEKIDELEKKMSGLGKSDNKIGAGQGLIAEADLILGKLFFNSHKARLYLVRGQINEFVALELKKKEDAAKIVAAQPAGGETPTTQPTTRPSGEGEVTTTRPVSVDECVLDKAYWSVEGRTVRDGEIVEMIVAGETCEGELIEFEIYEHDWFVLPDDFVDSLSYDYPSTSWRAEWKYAGDDDSGEDERDYYFIAKVFGRDVGIKSANLKVGKGDDVSGGTSGAGGEVVREGVHVASGSESLKDIGDKECSSLGEVAVIEFGEENADNGVIKNAGDTGILPAGTEVKIPEECFTHELKQYTLQEVAAGSTKEILFDGQRIGNGLFVKSSFNIYYGETETKNLIGWINEGGRIDILSFGTDVDEHLNFLDNKMYSELQSAGGVSRIVEKKNTGGVTGEFELNSEGIESERLRTLRGSGWTLHTALEEVNRRIGKYSENFNYILVDQLLSDGVLNNDEHRDIVGTGVFNLEGDMSGLRGILLRKSEIFQIDLQLSKPLSFSSPLSDKPLYFRYAGVWQWSPDIIVWINVPNIRVPDSARSSYAGQEPREQYKEIIIALDGRRFEDGLRIVQNAGGVALSR